MSPSQSLSAAVARFAMQLLSLIITADFWTSGWLKLYAAPQFVNASHYEED